MLNNNFQRILIKFGIWLITGIILMIIGITGVFADTYINIGDKTNVTVVLLSTAYSDAPITVPVGSEYNFYQVTALDISVDNYNFEANKNYQLELDLTYQTLTNANYYTVTGYNGEKCLISYEQDKTRFDGQYPRWAFECPNSTNHINITVSNSNGQYLWEQQQTNTFKWVYSYLKYSTTSLSSTGNNNNDIINNQNQNTQSIINNQNQNTQDIINNQNQNTDRIIEENKKNFQTCIDDISSDFNYVKGYILKSGDVYYYQSSPSESSVYIDLSKYDLTNNTININFDDFSFKPAWRRTYAYCLTNTLPTDNNAYTCNTSMTNTVTTKTNFNDIDTNNYKYLIIYGVTGVYNTTWFNDIHVTLSEPICTNKLDENKKAIEDLTGALTDDSPVDMSSLGNTAGWLPPGPIDSIINLPLNLFNNLLTALNDTCQSINIPLPYVDKNLPIPCISTIFNQIDGLPGFWNWVGAITSVVILYRYLLALYKYYDDLTTLKANFISDFGGEP